MRCTCCGEDRERVVGLKCHDEVKVCAVCAGWLTTQLGVVQVTTILPVLDMHASVRFYEAAGFEVLVYRDEHEHDEYAFVSLDDEGVFDLSRSPSAQGAGCFLRIVDADEWHDRLAALDYDVTPVRDEPWGMREFTLTDPSRNHLRFGQPSG